MTKILIALMVLLLTASCSASNVSLGDSVDRQQAELNALSDSGEGRLYINALAEAIEKSDRIVVTEHSNVDDVLDELTQPQRPKDYRPIVYTTRKLSQLERADFLVAIRTMTATTQNAEPACIFQPHHTIFFFRANIETSAMRVCFECGQVEWDASTKKRPWSLVPVLGALITRLGMKKERDWRALARTTRK